MMVEYTGENAAEAKSKVEALEARRARDRFGYAAHAPTTPASSAPSGTCARPARPAARHEGRQEAIASSRTPACSPSISPSSCRASRRSSPSTTRSAPTTATARSAAAYPPRHRPEDPRGMDQCGHRGRDHGAGGGVRRDDLQRARRRAARSPFLERMYGPTSWRPSAGSSGVRSRHRMNPGNIVDSPGILETPLRVSYKTVAGTMLDFSSQGGFAAAVECATAWACAARSRGHDCPSYMATKDEEHSTRGRANALRAGCRADGRQEFTASVSTRSWTSAWSARAARPSARPTWTGQAEVRFLHHTTRPRPAAAQQDVRAHRELNGLLSRVPTLANWMSSVPFNRCSSRRWPHRPATPLPALATRPSPTGSPGGRRRPTPGVWSDVLVTSTDSTARRSAGRRPPGEPVGEGLGGQRRQRASPVDAGHLLDEQRLKGTEDIQWRASARARAVRSASRCARTSCCAAQAVGLVVVWQNSYLAWPCPRWTGTRPCSPCTPAES